MQNKSNMHICYLYIQTNYTYILANKKIIDIKQYKPEIPLPPPCSSVFLLPGLAHHALSRFLHNHTPSCSLAKPNQTKPKKLKPYKHKLRLGCYIFSIHRRKHRLYHSSSTSSLEEEDE